MVQKALNVQKCLFKLDDLLIPNNKSTYYGLRSYLVLRYCGLKVIVIVKKNYNYENKN